MDLKTIGKFIAENRKNKGLTQSELGEKLGVTGKTISRWENGNYMPDISLLIPLTETLEISLNELLTGTKTNKKELLQKEYLEEYTKYLKNKKLKRIIFSISLSIISILLILLSVILLFNKTFFKTTYHSQFNDKVIIQIPKFSYYRGVSGMDTFTVKLKTLKQPDEVNIFIDNYLSTLENFTCNNKTYYYHKNYDFTIYQYRINNDGIGFINTIYISYHDGKCCLEKWNFSSWKNISKVLQWNNRKGVVYTKNVFI